MAIGKSGIFEFCFPVCCRMLKFQCSVDKPRINNKSFYIIVYNGYKPRMESGTLHTTIYVVDERRFFQKLNLWNKKFNVKFEAQE